MKTKSEVDSYRFQTESGASGRGGAYHVCLLHMLLAASALPRRSGLGAQTVSMTLERGEVHLALSGG